MTERPYTPMGIDHVVLYVRDQEASRKFYCDRLGCTVDAINEKAKIIHLRFGEQQIDIVPGNGPAAEAAKQGIDHLCLSIRCGDMPALAAYLKAQGIAVDDVVTRFGAYGTGPSIYLHDPDGFKLELKPR
jgi:catechol 2,3-dioxygenase-like lactoylglutathione lyase family enzyme